MADLWTIQYECNVEPPADANAWVLSGTDYVSVASGILTLDTVTPGTTAYCYYTRTSTEDIDFDTGFTLEVKVKVVTATAIDERIFFEVYDGTQDQWIQFRIGATGVTLRSTTTSTYSFDTTDDFHIYRLVVLGTNSDIYVDGTLRCSLTAVGSATVSDRVKWGDVSSISGTNSVFQMDYLYYYIGGAQIPSAGGVPKIYNAPFFGINF